MRRLFACILAVVLVYACANQAFATEITEYSPSQSASAELVYNLGTSYYIQIPETIDATMPYTFTADQLTLEESQQLVIRLTSLNSDNRVVLANEEGLELSFDVQYSGVVTTSIDTAQVVAVFTDSVTANGEMRLNPVNFFGFHRTGQYSGTAEFTVSIEYT